MPSVQVDFSKETTLPPLVNRRDRGASVELVQNCVQIDFSNAPVLPPLGNDIDAAIESDEMDNNTVLNTRLVFNIGGQRHETFVSTLKAVPGTRLSWIADNYQLLEQSPVFDIEKKEFFFDRNPACFEAILNYFRIGQLHYPNNVCGPVFKTELNFWGLDEEQMESCCWEAYTIDREKNDKMKGFKGPIFQGETKGSDMVKQTLSKTKCGRLRLQIWNFLDDPFSSMAAKVSILLTLRSFSLTFYQSHSVLTLQIQEGQVCTLYALRHRSPFTTNPIMIYCILVAFDEIPTMIGNFLSKIYRFWH